MKQIADIIAMRRFDYIVIEASGVCEPAPIAQTICSMEQMFDPSKPIARPRLDCIVTVVDALRLKSEFDCGGALTKKNIDEEDIENLIIEQIEFCNLILLNKISEVTRDEADYIKKVVRALQPSAKIIECDYCDVPLTDLLNTHLFDFESVATSATWVKELEKPLEEADTYDLCHSDENHEECHHHHEHDHEHNHEHAHEHGHEHEHEHHIHEEEGCHHHHHHHDHEHGEAEEYGIGTFVYYRRPPFDFKKFDNFVNAKWPKNIIRAKGVLYFGHNRDMSLLFEQAGVQKNLKEAGMWYATAPEDELRQIMEAEPGLVHDWDDKYGDRMVKLVFIGRDLDKAALTRELDSCLEPE